MPSRELVMSGVSTCEVGVGPGLAGAVGVVGSLAGPELELIFLDWSGTILLVLLGAVSVFCELCLA